MSIPATKLRKGADSNKDNSHPADEQQIPSEIRLQAMVLVSKGQSSQVSTRGEAEAFFQPQPPDMKGIHGKRALPSNTKDKSILMSMICPMASFIIRITSRGESTSFEVRQSCVLTPVLLTSSVILGGLLPHQSSVSPSVV